MRLSIGYVASHQNYVLFYFYGIIVILVIYTAIVAIFYMSSFEFEKSLGRVKKAVVGAALIAGLTGTAESVEAQTTGNITETHMGADSLMHKTQYEKNKKDIESLVESLKEFAYNHNKFFSEIHKLEGLLYSLEQRPHTDEEIIKVSEDLREAKRNTRSMIQNEVDDINAKFQAIDPDLQKYLPTKWLSTNPADPENPNDYDASAITFDVIPQVREAVRHAHDNYKKGLSNMGKNFTNTNTTVADSAQLNIEQAKLRVDSNATNTLVLDGTHFIKNIEPEKHDAELQKAKVIWAGGYEGSYRNENYSKLLEFLNKYKEEPKYIKHGIERLQSEEGLSRDIKDKESLKEHLEGKVREAQTEKLTTLIEDALNTKDIMKKREYRKTILPLLNNYHDGKPISEEALEKIVPLKRIKSELDKDGLNINLDKRTGYWAAI